jgi:hypothetical protein
MQRCCGIKVLRTVGVLAFNWVPTKLRVFTLENEVNQYGMQEVISSAVGGYGLLQTDILLASYVSVIPGSTYGNHFLEIRSACYLNVFSRFKIRGKE